MLSQICPVHFLPSYFPRKHFDITSRSSKQYFLLSFPPRLQTFVFSLRKGRRDWENYGKLWWEKDIRKVETSRQVHTTKGNLCPGGKPLVTEWRDRQADRQSWQWELCERIHSLVPDARKAVHSHTYLCWRSKPTTHTSITSTKRYDIVLVFL